MSVHTKKHLIKKTVEIPDSYSDIFEKFIKSLDGVILTTENNKEDDSEMIDFDNDPMWDTFKENRPGDHIRFQREIYNMTQKQLAEKLGGNVKQSYISALENGNKPISIKMAKKLSLIFNLSHRTFL